MDSSNKNIPLHLVGMQLAVSRVRQIAKEIDFEIFKEDWRYQSIVERQIEIISEASRKLSDEEKSLSKDINWRAIASIGNILRHEYKRIDIRIIWDIVSNESLKLETVVSALIERYKHKMI